MKRTFTVTVEEEEGTVHAEDIRRQLSRGEYRATVTETTAAHAKEREVIEAAMNWLTPNGDVTSAQLMAKLRELRALMEGKA